MDLGERAFGGNHPNDRTAGEGVVAGGHRPPTRSVWVTPLMHPAAVVRGMWAREPAQVAYIQRVIDLPPGWSVIDTSRPPPNTILYPNPLDLCTFTAQAHNLGCVAVDLETAGPYLLCAGLTAFQLEPLVMGTTLCLRFRLQGGEQYWQRREDLVAAVMFLGELLDNPDLTKVFHNGLTFDIPLLADHGFEVRGRVLDTMVMSWSCYSELPRGLQYLATLYLGAPVWKDMLDPKDEADPEVADETSDPS